MSALNHHNVKFTCRVSVSPGIMLFQNMLSVSVLFQCA